jgi:ATP-binding cassette, subfamily C (CFTR/MRP), member 10
LILLRSRLAIIPQEPFLFSGTLRENIDPLNEYSTPEIWTAVRKCHLEEVAFRLGSIDFNIGDHGQFLSVGQKQLVCLARAVLHNAKVRNSEIQYVSVSINDDSKICRFYALMRPQQMWTMRLINRFRR